jgi:hypothetical protein
MTMTTTTMNIMGGDSEHLENSDYGDDCDDVEHRDEIVWAT